MKKNVIYILSCFLLLTSSFLEAQGTKKMDINPTIDSLLNVLKMLSSPISEIKLVKGSDTVQINTLNLLCRQYINIGNYEQAMEYAQTAQQKAEKLNYKKGIAVSHHCIGVIYWYQGNYDKALNYHFKALETRQDVGNKKAIADSYGSIGNVFYSQGNYEKSINNYLKSLKIREEIGDKQGISSCYNNIGNIYRDQGKYSKALGNFLKSLKIKEQFDLEYPNDILNKRGLGNSYNNIGMIYMDQHNYDKALANYLKALEIRRKVGDKLGITASYNNIGLIYLAQRDYQKALNIYFHSMKISEEIGDKEGIGTDCINIGIVYLNQNKTVECHRYLIMSLNIFKELGFKNGIKESYSYLSKLFDKTGDYKQAYNYHRLYSDVKDTLLNEQSSKQIAEMNTKYESEKKEKDIQLLTKDKSLQQAEIGKQKFIRNGTIGGLILALLLAFILFNRFRVTSKQKKVIEFQNFQIVESINYSKKIQDSLLPSIESMQKSIPDLFVFFEPKAIVSGDFYWFKEFEKYTLLACVDCTGHGVPGGFMSTLGSLLLDKIADNENLSPSEILNKLSNEIIRVLHQQDGGEIQDGMDLSICLIDRHNRKIEFSGARNGIIVVTNELAKRYKADPLPVGGNYMKKGIAIERNFKTQHIPINPNDWIYMYTDGFMEQVGGADGIPMNYTQFENQLINVSKKQSPEEKNKLLQTELDNWRGIHERDDDVLIMGFQVA